MIPPGLKIPHPDAFRDALPSDAPPADFPSRLPFVVNQAMSYAASEDLAACSWPALLAGERPVAQDTTRPGGLRGAVTRVRDAMGARAGFLTPDPAAKAILDDLFGRVLASAASSGWVLNPDAPTPFPPGWRHVTLSRPGERMEVITLPSPSGTVVASFSFAESTA
jgi:hypothetical protein